MHEVTRHGARHPRTIFGKNLRDARRAEGLTQRQFGDLVSVDAITVSRWERGKSRPEDDHLDRVCAYFGRDLASFYTDTEEAAA